MTKLKFSIHSRRLSAIFAASFCITASAAMQERPGEIHKVHDLDAGYAKGIRISDDLANIGELIKVVPDPGVMRKLSEEKKNKGWLGVAMSIPTVLPKEPGSDLDIPAIEVTAIMPNSAAEAAGVRKGDLIVGLDGEAIEREHKKTLLSFGWKISNKHPGEKAKLRILRDGSPLDIEATIKPRLRVESKLKAHPDLADRARGVPQSLLGEALEKEGLMDEFARTLADFRNETDKVDSPDIREDGYHPFRLQEVNYLMNHPLDLPVVARKITNGLGDSYNHTNHDLAALLRVAMGELDLDHKPVKSRSSKPPADMSAYLVRLVDAIRHAQSERAAVLSVLSAEDVEFMYAAAPWLLVAKADEPDQQSAAATEQQAAKKETAADDEKGQEAAQKDKEEAGMLRLFRIAQKLDMSRLMNAAAGVAQALDIDTLAKLAADPGEQLHYPGEWVIREQDGLTVIGTPAGRVLVGGIQDNTYTEDAVLILDLGGNDRYLNRAGGSSREHPFSLVIDLSGRDTYAASENFAQGAGLLGGGFLVDLQGDDRYTARRYSQGAGLFGVGMLADLAGHDQYTAEIVSQGAASFGIGILAEGDGDDSYFGNRYVQGFGYVAGMGAIIEAGGADKYFAGGKYEDFRAPEKSYQSLSQGFGYGMRSRNQVSASGGIGVIAEAEGNDTYVADYFAQGASYWFALGILDDRKGHDRYIAGRYAQGAGVHLSPGILIDGAGDDNYLADYGVAQGCGHDYATGMLIDLGGNDRYVAGALSQGAGNDSGIGVLVDSGGHDEYYLRTAGQGRGNFDIFRDVGSFGFLIDTGGGRDVYSRGGANNSRNYQSQWGILVDTP